MRRLLVATTLGFGLLAGGGVGGSASARSTVEYTTSRTTDRPALIMPVHDDYDRPHYAPPPRHWHRPESRWHDHSRYDRDEGYHYGWR